MWRPILGPLAGRTGPIRGGSGGGGGGVVIEPGGSGGGGGGRVPGEVYFGVARSDPPDGVFTDVSASEFRSCGVRISGALECWGSGFGEDLPEGAFVQVSVAEGYRVPHGCALGAEGSVVCWGGNGYGQADAPEGAFVQVSAGGANSCGVRSDGSLSCWGNNEFGQRNVPKGSFTEVYAGSPSCALDAEGSLVCWGSPPAHRRSMPDAPEGEFVQVSAAADSDGRRNRGADYACGLRTSGEIVCWAAPFGTHMAYRWVPQASGRWQGWEVLKRTAVSLDYGQADPPPGRFVAVSAAAEHACAIDAQGRIVCWGNDYHHQLDPVAPRWGWSISNHYCSLSSDSDKAAPEGPLDCSVYARTHDYSLPLSGEVAREHPHGADDEFWGVHNGLVDPLRGPFVEVSAGGRGACGLRADAALVCWGVNGIGIEDLEGRFSQVTVGDHHACALREATDSSNSNVVCWGIDDSPPLERHHCARKPEADGYCTGPDPEHPQWRQQTEASTASTSSSPRAPTIPAGWEPTPRSRAGEPMSGARATRPRASSCRSPQSTTAHARCAATAPRCAGAAGWSLIWCPRRGSSCRSPRRPPQRPPLRDPPRRRRRVLGIRRSLRGSGLGGAPHAGLWGLRFLRHTGQRRAGVLGRLHQDPRLGAPRRVCRCRRLDSRRLRARRQRCHTLLWTGLSRPAPRAVHRHSGGRRARLRDPHRRHGRLLGQPRGGRGHAGGTVRARRQGAVLAGKGALFAGRRRRDARRALRSPARWPGPRCAAQASTCLGICSCEGRR